MAKKISYGSTWIFILSKNLGEEEAMHFSLGSENKAQEGRERSTQFALQAPSQVLLFLHPFLLQKLYSHVTIQSLQVLLNST